MDEHTTAGRRCHLCGKPIEADEAWMAAEIDGSQRAAHAGCVYRDEPSAGADSWWEPQEAGAGKGD